MTGIITEIQRFSLHDGDGIRTTVFLKGCNMRCSWCHNPETLEMKPQEAWYPAKCIHCGHCKTGCPAQARVTIGREMTPEEALHEVLWDRDYYAASGGGVTVSGGEPFLQADFLKAFLTLCKENGLRTAAETNLSLPWAVIAPCLPLLSHVYFDIKLLDDAAHRKWTGVSNRTVLENAANLAASGIPFTARTPLIPGVTDGEDNIRGIAAFLASVRENCRYELLNYNALAESKYEPIGRSYALPGARPLPVSRLRELAAAAASEGTQCRFSRG